MKKICEWCKKDFETKTNTKTCSVSCAQELRKQKMYSKTVKTCPVCGKEFHPFTIAQKTCSGDCTLKLREQTSPEIECPVCHKVFRKNFIAQKYCSDSCAGKSRTAEKVEKTCPKCGKVFLVPPNSSGAKKKFCSPTCARRGGVKSGKEIPCDLCGKMFYAGPGRLNKKNHFCSNDCRYKFYKDKTRKVTWTRKKGSAKTKRAFDKKSRDKALEVYGQKCEICGTTDHLNVHHVIRRRNFSVRWYVPNLIVLCVKHHMFGSELSAHGNSVAFAKWILEKRGNEWWEQLSKQSQQTISWQKSIDKIRSYLDGEIENYV